MTEIIIRRINHIKYSYLVEWILPNGMGYSDRFHTKKEIKEYFSTWENTIIHDLT